MNFIKVNNLAKSYGDRSLFEGIDFVINKGQKIAFVAKNGAGKTSMLKIMMGEDEPDTGTVEVLKDTKIAFLPQEPVLDESLTIEQTIFQSDSPVLKVVAQYERALRNSDEGEAYQQAFEQMDHYNAWDFERQYKQILSQLKVENTQQLVGTLSGGQRKRVALAHLLMDKPDVLLLDEPTNHLDLEMIEWLEAFFEREKMTLFMVTHDRYFLERVCTEILELDEGKLYRYKGNYSYFLEKKEERHTQENASLEKAKNHLKKELEWMRRQPKARGTKSKSRITDFYKTKEVASVKRDEREAELEINMERLGSKIVELHSISKSFDELTLLNKFSYHFKRKERLGIIGKNGTGKTTFLDIITGHQPVDAGKVVIGETVRFGYYSQKGIVIKSGQKVLDVVREVADYIPLTKGRKISAEQLLERFLFSRKKQYDWVEKLSGGERKRLYLCRVLMENPNFLILDEPTNDLDIVTLNILENFLMDYPGCLIVVSHDRYFMDKIVDHLFVFKDNAVVEDFAGNYSQYREKEQQPKEVSQKLEKKATVSKPPKVKTKLSFNEQREFELLEQEVAALETRKAELEQKFQEPQNAEDLTELGKEHAQVLTEIEQKSERWLELSILQESFE